MCLAKGPQRSDVSEARTRGPSVSSRFSVQGSKIVLVRSYLRVFQAAGQVNILIFLLKIKFSPCMPINFVMQGKCLFSDISRPGVF